MGSVFRENFNSILLAVILILVGGSIVATLHGFSTALLTSLDLAVLGTVLMCRGLVEKDASEKKFYAIWGLVLYSFAIAVATSATFSTLVGIAVLFVCLGLAVLFAVLY
uniref:Uncharacterized protein n=1 Tax=Ignisphaera aggregans TaxID=334771 RepID=A0A7C4BBW6_9CREN